MYEHREHVVSGFSDKYKIDRLLYYECTEDALAAIGREKQIKKWRRSKKIALIKGMNPDWKDLSWEWRKPRAGKT